MRKINIILAALLVGVSASCDKDSIDSLEGVYDFDRYTFTKVTNSPTEKLGKGIKSLNLTLSNDASNTLAISFGSSEWTLQTASYQPVTKVSGANQYSATLNGKVVPVKGSIDVSLIGETYFISGLVYDSSDKRYQISYKGSINFEIGVDDIESSGYVAKLTTSAVVVYDATWTPVTYPDVTKYTFALTDPDGNAVGSLEAINVNDAAAAALAGTYTVQASSTEAWLMDYGWTYPAYGMAGGSWFTDDSGAKQYIAAGKVSIDVVTGTEGETLATFTGTDLTTTSAAGDAGTGSFTIKYATLTTE